MPNAVLRFMSDASLFRGLGAFIPSLGLGYSVYVQPATGCVSGNDSPLCQTAAGIHGAHGVSGHAGFSLLPARSPIAFQVRYLVTRLSDATTQDITVAIQWRGRQ